MTNKWHTPAAVVKHFHTSFNALSVAADLLHEVIRALEQQIPGQIWRFMVPKPEGYKAPKVSVEELKTAATAIFQVFKDEAGPMTREVEIALRDLMDGKRPKIKKAKANGSAQTHNDKPTTAKPAPARKRPKQPKALDGLLAAVAGNLGSSNGFDQNPDAKAYIKKINTEVKIPEPLQGYLNRIGAECVNFRRAIVKVYTKGTTYYFERVIINWLPDGTIKCDDADYLPDENEQAAIKVAFTTFKFPISEAAVPQAYEHFLHQQGGDATRFFPLIDYQDGNKVKMVQERWLKPDGTKAFRYWTMFDDHEWRKLECDGPLPFYKPPKHNRGLIMIHESPKTARYLNDLINAPGFSALSAEQKNKVHPWAAELDRYDHWSLVTGALAPKRMDYNSLRQMQPQAVVYVCDRDYAGESALVKVSENYGEKMSGIKFGKDFPLNWDMADPMPKKFFTAAGRYKTDSPSLKSLIKPATFATKMIPNPEGKGKKIAVLKDQFKQTVFHCVEPEVFIFIDRPNEVHIATAFNSEIKPFSQVQDTARLLKDDLANKGSTLRYYPGKEPGIYGNGEFINTHVPGEIVAEAGDAGPWLEFMEYLVPVQQDREELMRWCATLIARPDIKMHQAVLCISEIQGIGKTTLGEKILGPLMGEDNFSTPNEGEITESQFNYWAAHVRLAVVNEIYGGHGSKCYDKLKGLISDKWIPVSKKYQANYKIENYLHIFACSNSPRAILLTMDDRRWLIPKINEVKRTPAYWNQFNAWLTEEGGLGIIKWWATEFLQTREPIRQEDAMLTDAKRAVIEAGYSPGMTLVARVLDAIKEASQETDAPKRAKFVTLTGVDLSQEGVTIWDTKLVELIKKEIHGDRASERLERPLTVRKVAKARGWFVHPTKQGTLHRQLICSFEAMTLMHIDEVLAKHPPLDVGGAVWAHLKDI